MKTKFFLLNKLVRDKAISLFQQEGATHIEWHTLDDNEDFLAALGEKVVEELEEVFDADSREHLIEELADVDEVLAAIKDLAQVSPQEVEAARLKKKAQKGGFSERIYIQYTETPIDSPLYKNFIKNSAKYPEVTSEQLARLQAEAESEEYEEDEE